MTDSAPAQDEETFRVLLDCSVREGAPTTSRFLCNLKEGTEVIVTHKEGRRAYIIQPVNGWCSLTKANGERILESIDEENRLIKKNIQLATPSRTKVMRPRREPRQMAKKFEDRIEQFRQRLVLADGDIKQEDIKFFGGIAVEISAFNQRTAVISLIIISCETMAVVFQETECINVSEPFVIGHKEFRQALACVKYYEKCVSKLQEKNIVPQILFIASSGILHPRRFGLACHVGLRLQIPTIGVETSLLAHPDIEIEDVRSQIQELESGTIEIKGGDASVGTAVKISAEEVFYVSPGDRISISKASTFFEAYRDKMPTIAANENVTRVLSELEEKNRLLRKLRQSPASSPQEPEFR